MTMRRANLSKIILLLLVVALGAHAQSGATPEAQASTDATRVRLETMSKLLVDTQRQLEQTQQQLNQLRREFEQLRDRESASEALPHGAPAIPLSPDASSTSQPPSSPATLAEVVRTQHEEQEVLEAEVKQHDQTKVESISKYPVRVYGLLLFNAFSNAGLVDNADLASVAIPGAPDQSHGSVGGSFRQTVLGFSANGPRLFGARSSTDLSMDFFGGSSYNYYGSPNGSVRLRRGDIRLAWGTTSDPERSRDEIQLGIDAPLISPISPTSYATVALPALGWSGNLWTWAPQLQYKHTFSLSSTERPPTVQLEGGLWDPPVVGTSASTPYRILSAGELSRRPGLLARASVHGGSADHPLAFGVGGYSDRQTYYEGQSIQMWAITSDWQIPLSNRFQLTGEIYRGRGLGGLGGGTYKDVLTGIDPHTGLSRTLGLNAVGGWAQGKLQLFHGAETNLIFGQDGGFASDFRQLDLRASTYPLETSARNRMLVANMIYRPRTYLILSPEYRRILSWKTTGPPATANIFTLSLGYQF